MQALAIKKIAHNDCGKITKNFKFVKIINIDLFIKKYM